EMSGRLAALGVIWPIVVIFLVVMGGIYAGLFTPTEAAGIGSFATLAAAIGLRRMTFAIFKDSLMATATTSAMIFLIVIGSSVFSSFLSVTGITVQLGILVSGSDVPPLVVLIVVLISYLVLGCF